MARSRLDRELLREAGRVRRQRTDQLRGWLNAVERNREHFGLDQTEEYE
ncbi:MAG TPA: hypothetical protein VEQ37_05085 [Actinomycetota bacterium]|nr:hypothetical protein [Actinomycetota bacterium]